MGLHPGEDFYRSRGMKKVHKRGRRLRSTDQLDIGTYENGAPHHCRGHHEFAQLTIETDFVF